MKLLKASTPNARPADCSNIHYGNESMNHSVEHKSIPRTGSKDQRVRSSPEACISQSKRQLRNIEPQEIKGNGEGNEHQFYGDHQHRA